MKVLQVAAEVFPLVKTGGLADVVGALPQALAAAGADVRLLLPGLPAIVAGIEAQRVVCELGPMFGAGRVRLLLGVLPDRLRVLHAMRGGPGERAGWRAGETICRIDGEPVTAAYPASAVARWTIGEPGRVVRLTACSGADKPVTLRRFY